MQDAIAAVRRFNRFHTHLVGALNEHFLASDFSLPQVRVLYEIANAPLTTPPSARDLSESLRMDTGFLSRILSGLVDRGLISRDPSPENAKRLTLKLTDAGRDVFARLDASSASEIGAILAPLSLQEQRELVGAMSTVERLLGNHSKDAPFVLRDPQPGDLALIAQQNARLYAKEYGWDWTFEALVSEIIAQFIQNFDPSGERCWIAERDGQVVGSIFVVRQDSAVAKLRILYVDERARGLGLGSRLVEEAVQFAKDRGYQRMILWTNDILTSARRIYEAAGFTLIEEESHHSFGKDLVGQVWELDLA